MKQHKPSTNILPITYSYTKVKNKCTCLLFTIVRYCDQWDGLLRNFARTPFVPNRVKRTAKNNIIISSNGGKGNIHTCTCITQSLQNCVYIENISTSRKNVSIFPLSIYRRVHLLMKKRLCYKETALVLFPCRYMIN